MYTTIRKNLILEKQIQKTFFRDLIVTIFPKYNYIMIYKLGHSDKRRRVTIIIKAFYIDNYSSMFRKIKIYQSKYV